MPSYTELSSSVEINDYSEGVGRRVSSIFPITKEEFSANSLGKNTPAPNERRQNHFVEQIRIISRALGSRVIPVWITHPRIRGGGLCRLDKGCIGHAVAAGILRSPVNGPEGYVETVELAEWPC